MEIEIEYPLRYAIQGIVYFVTPAAPRLAASVNLWAPSPTFDERRAAAAADNLSPRRIYHVGDVFNYFVAFFMLCTISL